MESFFRRGASVKRLLRDLRGKTPISPIVLTPEEVTKRLERGDQFIEQMANGWKLEKPMKYQRCSTKLSNTNLSRMQW